MASISWKSAFVEGTMVLLGVLLALLVDEWREDLNSLVREHEQFLASFQPR